MRISVTEREDISAADLRPAAELAPALVLPWLIRLRYGLLIGQAMLICVASFVSHIELPLAWLAIPLLVTAVSNLLLRALIARFSARNVLGLTLTLDVLSLTGVLALSGGAANPFSLLYLVQITLSAVVLSKAWTWSLGALSILSFGFLFLAHVPVPVLEGHHPAQGFSAHLFGMWIAFVAAALLISVLIGKVSEALRSHEQEVLRLQSQLNRQERIASIATLAAGAAHELGTPLATIAVVARELEHYAAGSVPDPHLATEARLIRTEVDRCGSILHGMSAQGAELIGETPTLIRVRDLMNQLRNSFPESQRHAIAAEVDGDLEATLPVETTRQVLAALVKNGIDASSVGQPVKLACGISGDMLRFVVQDTGKGMTPETLKRVGEPFFTTKGPQKGMGLGTFLVCVFAENLHGSLVFDSVVDQGTTAILELPLVT